MLFWFCFLALLSSSKALEGCYYLLRFGDAKFKCHEIDSRCFRDLFRNRKVFSTIFVPKLKQLCDFSDYEHSLVGVKVFHNPAFRILMENDVQYFIKFMEFKNGVLCTAINSIFQSLDSSLLPFITRDCFISMQHAFYGFKEQDLNALKELPLFVWNSLHHSITLPFSAYGTRVCDLSLSDEAKVIDKLDSWSVMHPQFLIENANLFLFGRKRPFLGLSSMHAAILKKAIARVTLDESKKTLLKESFKDAHSAMLSAILKKPFCTASAELQELWDESFIKILAACHIEQIKTKIYFPWIWSFMNIKELIKVNISSASNLYPVDSNKHLEYCKEIGSIMEYWKMSDPFFSSYPIVLPYQRVRNSKRLSMKCIAAMDNPLKDFKDWSLLVDSADCSLSKYLPSSLLFPRSFMKHVKAEEEVMKCLCLYFHAVDVDSSIFSKLPSSCHDSLKFLPEDTLMQVYSPLLPHISLKNAMKMTDMFKDISADAFFSLSDVFIKRKADPIEKTLLEAFIKKGKKLDKVCLHSTIFSREFLINLSTESLNSIAHCLPAKVIRKLDFDFILTLHTHEVGNFSQALHDADFGKAVCSRFATLHELWKKMGKRFPIHRECFSSLSNPFKHFKSIDEFVDADCKLKIDGFALPINFKRFSYSLFSKIPSVIFECNDAAKIKAFSLYAKKEFLLKRKIKNVSWLNAFE